MASSELRDSFPTTGSDRGIISIIEPADMRSNVSNYSMGDVRMVMSFDLPPDGPLAPFIVAYISATLGTAAFALPICFREGGIVLASAILGLVVILTARSVSYLSLAIQKLELCSFEELARSLLGPVAERVVRILLVGFVFGAMVVYLIFIGDLFHPFLPWLRANIYPDVWIKYIDSSGRATTLTIYVATVVIPMLLHKDVNSLRIANFVGLCANSFICLFVVVRFFHHAHYHHLPSLHSIRLVRLHPGALITLPVILFAFNAMPIVFQLFTELFPSTVERMAIVTRMNISFSSFVFSVMGLFGYISFGKHTRGNILANYDPSSDFFAALAYIAAIMSITLSLVVNIFPCRNAMLGLFTEQFDLQLESSRMTVKRHWVATFTIVAAALSISLRFPSFVMVIAILGSLGSSTFGFILPALFALKLDASGIHPATDKGRAMMYTVLGVGVFSLVVGLSVAVFHDLKGLDVWREP